MRIYCILQYSEEHFSNHGGAKTASQVLVLFSMYFSLVFRVFVLYQMASGQIYIVRVEVLQSSLVEC